MNPAIRINNQKNTKLLQAVLREHPEMAKSLAKEFPQDKQYIQQLAMASIRTADAERQRQRKTGLHLYNTNTANASVNINANAEADLGANHNKFGNLGNNNQTTANNDLRDNFRDNSYNKQKYTDKSRYKTVVNNFGPDQRTMRKLSTINNKITKDEADNRNSVTKAGVQLGSLASNDRQLKSQCASAASVASKASSKADASSLKYSLENARNKASTSAKFDSMSTNNSSLRSRLDKMQNEMNNVFRIVSGSKSPRAMNHEAIPTVHDEPSPATGEPDADKATTDGSRKSDAKSLTSSRGQTIHYQGDINPLLKMQASLDSDDITADNVDVSGMYHDKQNKILDSDNKDYGTDKTPDHHEIPSRPDKGGLEL